MKALNGKVDQSVLQLSERVVPQVSSMEQEMQSYDPWDVLAVLDVLLRNIAFNMTSPDAMYLSFLATNKQIPKEYDDILIKIAERMDAIRRQNFLSRM